MTLVLKEFRVRNRPPVSGRRLGPKSDISLVTEFRREVKS